MYAAYTVCRFKTVLGVSVGSIVCMESTLYCMVRVTQYEDRMCTGYVYSAYCRRRLKCKPTASCTVVGFKAEIAISPEALSVS